jgi:lipopolysaccharide/colanic/teichoic acid biosynthesis glycosyltransferase
MTTQLVPPPSAPHVGHRPAVSRPPVRRPRPGPSDDWSASDRRVAVTAGCASTLTLLGIAVAVGLRTEVVAAVIATVCCALAAIWATSDGFDVVRRRCLAACLGAVGVLTCTQPVLGWGSPRSAVSVVAALSATALVHAAVLSAALRAERERPESVLLVGGAGEPDDVVAGLPRGWQVVEVVPAATSSDEESSLRRLATALDAAPVDRVVFVAGNRLESDRLHRASWVAESRGVRFSVLSNVVWSARQARLVSGGAGLVDLRPAATARRATWVKHALDRVGAAALLLVLAVPLAVLAAIVRLDSAGSPVFRQERVGLRGRPFTMYKLRSMAADAEDRLDGLRDQNEGSGPLFKMRSDPRITRVGAFLRRTSLDELPQLLNVLRGEMSLVGPRPALATEVAHHDAVTARRLAVRPGMTGLWQVGGRSGLDWDASTRLDVAYVDGWTVGGDLAIAARTVRAVVARDGAF